jgi:glycosyltransferase involved in cell wall biosynthesis
MQRRVVRKASAIVATTASSAGTLTRIRDDAGGTARVLCIHNGFDPDDFARPAPPARRDSRYRIVYAGTLWNLTSVAPLIDAVSALCRQSPEVAARLELVLAGRRTTDQQRTLTRLLETPVHVVEHNYMAHDLVLDLMRSADVLCALLTDAPGAERVLPGKIFEYMACRRPILAIAPPGDLWQVLEDYPAAHRYEPSDVGGITAFLARRLQEFETSATKQAIMWDDPRYNRREQARTLAGLLSDITGSSPGS